MRLITTPAAVLLNNLLDGEPWARARLVPFAGETVQFSFPPVPALRLAIGEGGRIAPGISEPTLTLSLREGAFAAVTAAAPGEDRLLQAIDISGNARLASEILLLARHLRWDAEEDLSRLVGDVLAHRIAGAVRAIAGWHLEAGRRVSESVMDYVIEERGLLVRRSEFEVFSADVAQLRDRVERLVKRLELAGAAAAPGR